VIDLALLGAGTRAALTKKGRARGALAAIGLITLLDAAAWWRLRRSERALGRSLRFAATESAVRLRGTVTIDRAASELFDEWRRLDRLPDFLRHVEAVEKLDERRSHWRASGPLGKKAEWDAEIIEERPGELLAWQSLPGGDVVTRGEIRFVPAPGGHGTEVHVELEYTPPGGGYRPVVAKFLGKVLHEQLSEDLRRFKQVMETGEVVRSDASAVPGMHPARPGA